MKSVFANSNSLEVLGEIAGERCHEFFIRDNQKLALISRPFTFNDEETALYLFMTLSKKDDPEVKLKLQIGCNKEGKILVIDRTIASDKEGCARLRQKIKMFCAALTLERTQSSKDVRIDE